MPSSLYCIYIFLYNCEQFMRIKSLSCLVLSCLVCLVVVHVSLKLPHNDLMQSVLLYQNKCVVLYIYRIVGVK